MLCANYWIISTIGPTPRKITPVELAIIKARLSPDFYGISHYNHPCTVWARSSQQAHEYLMCYAYALNDEYGYRYGKSHKSIAVINRLPELQYTGLYTPPAQAMPDEYKRDDAVAAYHAYYQGAKSHIASWKFRERPPWYEIIS